MVFGVGVFLYIVPWLLWEIVFYSLFPTGLFAHLKMPPPNPRSWSGDKSIEVKAMPAETGMSWNVCKIQDLSVSSK